MVGLGEKVIDFATSNVVTTVDASTVAAGGLFMATYHLMGPSLRKDKGTSTRNFFTLSKGLGGLKRKEVTGEWEDYDKTFTQVCHCDTPLHHALHTHTHATPIFGSLTRLFLIAERRSRN